MNTEIRTLLYGNAQECRAAVESLKMVDPFSACDQLYLSVDDLEEFERNLVDWDPTLLVILADGAEGMECVYRARDRRPCLPVFWFSNDRDFAIQSYRLNCAYFSTKPVTPDKINQAIHRCSRFGIQYGTA